jgi:hypothetical protein
MRGAMGHDGVHALHARQRPDDRQSVERDRPQARMVRSNVMGCGRGSSVAARERSTSQAAARSGAGPWSSASAS